MVFPWGIALFAATVSQRSAAPHADVVKTGCAYIVYALYRLSSARATRAVFLAYVPGCQKKSFGDRSGNPLPLYAAVEALKRVWCISAGENL